jgi:hypothetical protein
MASTGEERGGQASARPMMPGFAIETAGQDWPRLACPTSCDAAALDSIPH